MQGNYNHGRPHYRCRFPSEYALVNEIDHPKTVYVREDHMLDPLDQWLSEAFSPHHVEHSLTAMVEAQEESEITAQPEQERARREVAECDRKLARHKAALEAGADPALVTSWMQEVQKDKSHAEARLAAAPAQSGGQLTADQIREIVTGLGGLLQALRRAAPEDKAHLYKQLGLRTCNKTDLGGMVAGV